MSEKPAVPKANGRATMAAGDSGGGSWLLFVVVNLAMVLVGIFVANYFQHGERGATFKLTTKDILEGGANELLGLKGALLFNSLDADHNGAVSFQEFGPIVEKLTGEVCLRFICSQTGL